jgi:photosystem II stability/assembly factor-like uncharacterized protein
MFARSIRLALLVSVLALVPAAAANAASLWTPLTTGTSDDISAISTPKSGEIVFATTNGAIYYQNSSGGFTPATLSPTPSITSEFNSVAMSPDGTDGVAVGSKGLLYYSSDSGEQWTAVSPKPQTYKNGDCTGWSDDTTLTDDLYSVKYVPASAPPYTVYITGNNSDILRATNDGESGQPTFTEVNKKSSPWANPASSGYPYCIADPGYGGGGLGFTDQAWINSTTGYFLSNSFGDYFTTTDGLTDTPGGTSEGASSLNGATPDPGNKLAVDAANPAVACVAGGGGFTDGIECTTDGGTNWTTATYGADGSENESDVLNDIAGEGTTFVAVGNGGDLWNSSDGVTFYDQVAAAPNSTNDWNAVAMVPGTTTAVVGGDNGALVYTARANEPPDTVPPTGSITGPTSLAVKQYGTYTLHPVDNASGPGLNTSSYAWSIPDQSSQKGLTATFAFSSPGTYNVTATFSDLDGLSNTASITVKVPAPGPTGSGQKKTTTGGATVGIYKKVTVPKGSGKNRYIPIYLLDKTPRKFVITLLTAPRKHKKQKTLAKLTTTLKKGHKDVHLKLPSSVKSGSYELEVRLYTTGKHAKAAGKRIKQLFVLS